MSSNSLNTKLLLTMGPGLEPDSRAHVLVLDWQRREIIDQACFNHEAYSQSHKGLAGASPMGDGLLVASEAEVLEMDLNPLRIRRRHTFPFLNDVHHVAYKDDHILVCNTGLDCIEVLDSKGKHLETLDLTRSFGRRPRQACRLLLRDLKKSWKRMRGRYDYYTHLTHRPFCRNVVKLLRPKAYRTSKIDLRFSDFRPHLLHPNHILPLGRDVWVTLWTTGEIVSLDSGRVIADGLGHPHDGIVAGDEFYVTDCAQNRLIVYRFNEDPPSLGEKLFDRVITNTLFDGFLRGVAVEGEYVFVALTARRGAAPEQQAARIVALERSTLEILDEWTVPKEFGTSVYTVASVSDSYNKTTVSHSLAQKQVP